MFVKDSTEVLLTDAQHHVDVNVPPPTQVGWQTIELFARSTFGHIEI